MNIITRLVEVESEGRHWIYKESRVRERMNKNYILLIYLAATFALFVCPSYHLLITWIVLLLLVSIGVLGSLFVLM